MEYDFTLNLARIHEAIAAASARVGRDPASVTLLAASKNVPPERLREAYAAGIRCFGENRVQDRDAKQASLAGLPIEWHLLGPLQSNKAARALELFDVIETVDSLALAQRLSRLARQPVLVMLEVNLACEPQKHGVAPAHAVALTRAAVALPNLRLCGVMAVPPAAENPEASRPHFRALVALSAQIRAALPSPPARWDISMGMSHDFPVAIEEGATVVRLGAALFGPRPQP
ncbi:MAG: YggS family pyridoxal phosphate-dependent enzyme [Terriglobales bacterium]